jgi:hypothetical protein
MDRARAEDRMVRGFGKEWSAAWPAAEPEARRPVVGKTTLVEGLGYPPVQRKAAADADPAQIQASAQRGIATGTSALPYGDRIQRLFGRHDISGVKAHTGGDAAASARAMGAAAYATGDHVVLGEGADLRTVAHEVAHVVQQRGGVQLLGGVGAVGDAYERHADAVAELVVGGQSAEALLDQYAPGGGAGSAGAGPVQRMVLRFRGDGRYDNLEPNAVAKGEKLTYDMAIAEDRRAVEAHWARQQMLQEEEDRRRQEDEDSDEPPPPMLDQLLVAPPQGVAPQAQAQGAQHGQSHVPDISVNFGGSEYLDPRSDRIIASSKTIDLHASWTPGDTPPSGHTKDAVVGWIQNIVHHNKQADYFDAEDRYVETMFKEHNGPVIDSDDPGSPWYDPPRPYQEVRSAEQQKLFGGAARTGARGIPLSDKPQDAFLLKSPRGGDLYRFGGETEFIACLVIAEPDGSRQTVLEWVAWKYEWGYTLVTLPEDQRPEHYERPTAFTTLYADTRITGRATGAPPRDVTLVVGGTHGNAFFDQLKPSWEQLSCARDPYDPSRFPSFI